jgi:hypothetical protein
VDEKQVFEDVGNYGHMVGGVLDNSHKCTQSLDSILPLSHNT